MSLRSITLKLSSGLLAALTLAFAVSHSNAQPLDESTYKPVATQFNVSSGDKIEVAELFWFGCGHCFALEPTVKKWNANKPDNVEFVKIPAIFSKRWEFHGKAFYTMKALNVPEEAYDAFFHSIHIKRKQINNLGALTEFLAKFDKTEDQINSAFNSFEVDSKVRAAIKISRQSGATGVPTIVVDGKYQTSQGMTGGVDGLFKTVDLLVEKAASER
ncbi:thiol:disulfide interchange protein DsbA [Arenicella sp. 4NH20-0111]|uniref:thiol:disulfide interchange protein DsbA/DsbL n=1 Tax=Arenicella sp. 4NH20-0111 TaxID=3127648 RepID=UPI00310AA045